jgi:hypothetical protein
MKRFLTLLAVLMLSATALSAQTNSHLVIEPGMKYKQLKNFYNPKEYVSSATDPYSRAWLGLGSFLSPGLGQIGANEAGRGISFMLGSALVSGIGGAAAANLVDLAERDSAGNYYIPDENMKAATAHLAVMLGAAAADLAIKIWSCADAVRVAKVKNMYYGDLMQQHSMEVRMYPSVNVAQTSNGVKPVAGMSLAVNF